MSSDRYLQAKELADAGDVDASWQIVKQLLVDNPLDPRALVTGSFLMRIGGRLPESYHFARAATKFLPDDAAPWINLGHASAELWRLQEAEECYKRALKCSNIGQGTLRRNTMLNFSAIYVDSARYAEAKAIAEEMLKIDPKDQLARANLGFCQLAMRDWSGWANYRSTIGTEFRPRLQYCGEPEWDGTHGLTVALHGEQGLGDEISFASMLPDAQAVCKKLILDCDSRLTGLFKRSFPGVHVYGTRKASQLNWAKEDRKIDASLPMGQIGEYFRTTDDSFPGLPYLVPCPQRTQMWRSYFAGLGKPVIGIAWRGGIPKSNARNRQWMLDDLLPLFRSIDAHYVSLQYKDASKEIAAFLGRHPGVDIAQYPWATLTSDYDDTAALIAAMDHVFCMQTAVAHTAGALGIPATVCVPFASQWRYGLAEDSIPWYRSLRVVRQKKHGSWTAEIERGVGQLKADISGLRGTEPQDEPAGAVRGSFSHIRPAGVEHHRPNGSDALA